jgi:type IV secretion system protein VirB8
MKETMKSTKDAAAARAARGAYYESAATWADDIIGSLRRSRRTAWIIAGGALLIAGLEAIALAGLTPLKTVVPLTFTVDRQTGYVQSVADLKPGALSQDQAITQSFLVQYVLAREGFDATDLRQNYRKVMLWSAGEARATYQTMMQRATPGSPLATYHATSLVTVSIKSVSLLSPGAALVRFDKSLEERGAPQGQPQPFAAVIAFRYSAAPMNMGDRFINPLGFQVTRYRRDAESPAAAGGSLP